MTEPQYPFPHRFDASRYSRAYLCGHVSESDVQKVVKDGLWMHHIDASFVDAGFSAVRGKIWSALMGAKIPEPQARMILARVTGVCAAPPGWADLSGCIEPNGRAFFLECKAPAWVNPATGKMVRAAEKPTRDQLSFMLRMHRRGALVGVVWSLDDALEILAPALAGIKHGFR